MTTDTRLTQINRIPFRILKGTLMSLKAVTYLCISIRGEKDLLSAKTVAAQEWTQAQPKPTRLTLLTHVGLYYKLCQEWQAAFAGDKMAGHIEKVLHECAWVGEMLAVVEKHQ